MTLTTLLSSFEARRVQPLIERTSATFVHCDGVVIGLTTRGKRKKLRGEMSSMTLLLKRVKLGERGEGQK
jgi:hypothetical protein